MDDLSFELIDAAQNGKFEEVLLLIDKGADINVQDRDGWTTLMYASIRKTNVAKILVDLGANLNIKDRDGWNALMFASMAGNADVVTFLLKNGADIHAIDNRGRAASDIAAEYGKKNVVLLIKGYIQKQDLLPEVDGLDDSLVKLVL